MLLLQILCHLLQVIWAPARHLLGSGTPDDAAAFGRMCMGAVVGMLLAGLCSIGDAITTSRRQRLLIHAVVECACLIVASSLVGGVLFLLLRQWAGWVVLSWVFISGVLFIATGGYVLSVTNSLRSKPSERVRPHAQFLMVTVLFCGAYMLCEVCWLQF